MNQQTRQSSLLGTACFINNIDINIHIDILNKPCRSEANARQPKWRPCPTSHHGAIRETNLAVLNGFISLNLYRCKSHFKMYFLTHPSRRSPLCIKMVYNICWRSFLRGHDPVTIVKVVVEIETP